MKLMIKKTIQPIIGIVLPAYNEDAIIGDVLKSLPESVNVDGSKYKIQLIVVNDGSEDSTAQVVKSHKGVVLINHIINSGAGAATRTGLHYARNMSYGYAVTMDSDGQHSVEDVKRLIKSVISNEADLVIGSRLKGKDGNMPRHKRIGNLGLGLITYLLLGVYASDTQSGLKAFNRKAMELIEFHSNDYAFCSEMIWKARQAKLRIIEVPIEAIYTEYSISRGQKNFSGAINITKQLIKRRLMSFIHE